MNAQNNKQYWKNQIAPTLIVISFSVNVIFGLFFSYKLFQKYHEKPIRKIINDSYWKDKVSQYEVLNLQQKNSTLFVGDSMVERFHVEEFFPENNIFNRGNAWDDTRSLLARLDNTVMDAHPKKVILWIGINDILYHVSFSDTIKNFKTMIDQLQATGINVVVISCLPVWKENQRNNKDIGRLNGMLKKLCKEKNVQYLDIFDNFLSDKDELRRDFSNDGTHLNGKGYAYFASLFSSLLNTN